VHVTVISADRSLFNGEADAVLAPAFDGLVGILPHHAPLLTLLGAGTLSVRHAAQTSTFRVTGGFLQVVGDRVRAVADRAEPT